MQKIKIKEKVYYKTSLIFGDSHCEAKVHISVENWIE